MVKRTEKAAPGNGPAQFSREHPAVRRSLLIEAARRCIAEGGIAAFTVDNISRKAGVSRGLLNHYFPSKNDLLIEIYRTSLYSNIVQPAGSAAGVSPEVELCAMVEANFAPRFFSRSDLLLWLSLWTEIAVNPELKAIHRKLYDAYRAALAHAIERVAELRRHEVDSSLLALSFLSLVDGLWIEWCLNPKILSRKDARNACYAMLEAHLGHLRDISSPARRLRAFAAPHTP